MNDLCLFFLVYQFWNDHLNFLVPCGRICFSYARQAFLFARLGAILSGVIEDSDTYRF